MSKGIPEATKNHSITELDLCGLAFYLASLAHLLKKVDFNAIVDHLDLVNIIKCMIDPVTSRIKRLLEVLNLYHLIYIVLGEKT